MFTLYSLPPHAPEHVAALPDTPAAHHVVAVDESLGEHAPRWIPDRSLHLWKRALPEIPAGAVRPPDLPVLQDGFDFGSWIARYGRQSIQPIDLHQSVVLLHFHAAAAGLVRQDATALHLEAALHAQADLGTLCERLHYALDPDNADLTEDQIIYDALTEKFWWLRRL